MKLFSHPLICLLILLMPGMHAFAQDSASVTHTAAGNNAGFPKDSSAWESYLRRNVDTMVPVRNKAKKGSYTVVVRFIITKDGVVSDVAAVTNYGYGMEEEVMLAIKKYSVWGWRPAPQNSKPVIEAHTVSFTFVVPKRKFLR
jgi:outer membrane biosynthesis protein TonB